LPQRMPIHVQRFEVALQSRSRAKTFRSTLRQDCTNEVKSDRFPEVLTDVRVLHFSYLVLF
jgi:hypothetical protein